ncbi:MAG: xanthine dehydrogenase family protein molybdopterin-binding subunit [Acidobacteria bacterium]|nr:xanthine dehydrogenase family protein molybdopterin-binding subunit [Acidobacteriota bacterium]
MRKEHYIPNATYEHENEPEVLYENGFPINLSKPGQTKAGFARRDFLKGVGVMVVGFGVAGSTAKITGGSTVEAAGMTGAAGTGVEAATALADPPIDQVDSYLVVGQDGGVTILTSLVDLGQGISQQYIQWVAEEMEVSMARIRVILGDTGLVANDGGMFGSRATNLSGAKFRRAAAAAKAKLLELAGERFGVSPSDLTVHDGVVSVKTEATKSVSYAELIAGKRFDVEIPSNFEGTKPWQEYKIIGQPISRVDIPVKLTGEEEYVHDVRLPGMLYGRAIRPRGQSLYQHSVLLDVDESSVADVKGLVKIVAAGHLGGVQGLGGQFNFVGVICEREEQAVEAASKLKVTWAEPPEIPADLYQHLLAVGRTTSTRQNGDLEAALAIADKVLEATYTFPFQAHASMGSVAAVGDVKLDSDGKVVSAQAWSSTQATHTLRNNVRLALGIPADETADKVRVLWRWGAGSYGSNNGNPIVGVDAAVMSAAVGRPVKVQWFREDTHGWESYGPIHLFKIKAGLDASGNVIAYEFDSWGATANNNSSGERYKFGRGSATFRVMGGNPTGGTFFLTAPLRAPSQPATTFASESFIDEMAAAVSADPVQFRLRHLDPADPAQARGMDVIAAAAERFGWDTRPSPNPAHVANRSGVVRGRGIAYGPRSQAYVATVMEVEVDQATGAVRPIRAVVAHDIGLIVNPESLRQQIEGQVAQTTSRALWEEIKHDGRRVSTLDWLSYPYLKMTEFPRVESVLINRPELGTGSGAGEAATVSIVGAVANAIFDATGARLRQAPFTPERVLEALNAR